MSELVSLCAEIADIFFRRQGQQRHALGYFNPQAGEISQLYGIVREQPHLANAEIVQHLHRDSVAASIGRQALMQVCFNRVAPRVLHLIGTQLVLQADASAFVVAQI